MVDDIARQQVRNITGSAVSFTDIDGIGPKTAQKIRNAEYGINGPADVSDMSADELADKAGISRSRAQKAIKGGGGNPSVSKRGNSGTVSAAGISQRVGDFTVDFADMDKARAQNDAQSRSEEAVKQDNRKRAPVTTDYERWASNKSGLDYPGVDTPSQQPDLLPKDLKQRQQPETTDFEARDEEEAERKRQSFPRKTADARGNERAILETGDDRIPAGEVARNVPNAPGIAPALAPNDFEQEPDTPSQTMGPTPSAQRLPADARDNLGTQPPESALEQQGGGSDSSLFNLPDRTLADLRTELNEQVYGEGRDELNDLRERVTVGEPIELSPGEYRTAATLLRDRKEDAQERAGRMDRNIFGSTDEQAEMAQEAFRGLVSNPPR